MPVITLDPDVKAQMQTWLTEPDGINDWLTTHGPSDPEYNWNKAQKDLYELLIAKDGKMLQPHDLTPLMLDIAQQIRDSYDRAVELEYDIYEGGPKMQRSKMRGFFQNMLTIGGRP